MPRIATRDIIASMRSVGLSGGLTVPSGISTYFQNASYILFGCWVKEMTGPIGTPREFMIFNGGAGGSNFAQLAFVSNAQQIYLRALGTNSAFVDAPSRTWLHVIAEINIINSRVRMWVNGSLMLDAAIAFADNLNTVTSMVSTIRDSGAGFEGFIADAFILNRNARATADEIDALYARGELPSAVHSFQWPIRTGLGATVPCLDNAGVRTLITGQFDGVAVNTFYSRDTPMKLPFVDRNAGKCIRLNNTGLYRNATDYTWNMLQGAPVVGISVWARPDNPVNHSVVRDIINIPTSANNAAIILSFLQNTGQIRFGGRSDATDAFQSTTPPIGGYFDSSPSAEWHNYAFFIDYQNKIIQGYVDGILIARAAGLLFNSNFFNTTRSGGSAQVNFGTTSFEGYLDDFVVFRTAVAPTDATMREWYLTGKIPTGFLPVVVLDCEDVGPNLIDKSGLIPIPVEFDPISIVAPFGLRAPSYIP